MPSLLHVQFHDEKPCNLVQAFYTDFLLRVTISIKIIFVFVFHIAVMNVFSQMLTCMGPTMSFAIHYFWACCTLPAMRVRVDICLVIQNSFKELECFSARALDFVSLKAALDTVALYSFFHFENSTSVSLFLFSGGTSSSVAAARRCVVFHYHRRSQWFRDRHLRRNPCTVYCSCCE